MWGWISWREAGHVDRLGREGVATLFLHFLIPVWPRRTSHYRFRDSEGSEVWFEIPRNRRSVALGFVRTPVWLAASILVAGGIARAEWWAIAIGLALGIVGGVLTFAFGALDPGERERRALLHRITGLGAPPELMPAQMRVDARDRLADAWFHEHGTDWRSSILAGIADEALVALAEYDRAPQLLIRARTNLIDAEGN